MFERYTEKARRTIFFARYEASQFGSHWIESEHLLLGLLREDSRLSIHFLPGGAAERIRKKMESFPKKGPSLSTSVDLPLSDAAKRILDYAADEAEHLKHKHIGTAHLFLGLLREEAGLGAQILQEFNVKLTSAREKIATLPEDFTSTIRSAAVTDPQLILHRVIRDGPHIRFVVEQILRPRWHWRREVWTPFDVVADVATGEMSFDLSLEEEDPNFKFAKGGCISDNCLVCGWKLFESPILEHGTGYTNGRNWLCIECYDKFFRDAKPVPPPNPEIT